MAAGWSGVDSLRRSSAGAWVPVFLRYLALLVLVLPARARDFDLRRDTFAFSNDTALAYGVDEQGQLHISLREKPVEYSHRCFVLARAVLQFHQFARFEPKQAKLSREEYRVRLKRLCRIPVWASGPRERIVFSGFADLRGFSVAYEGLLKENLGNWLPTYLRVGNWRMCMGHLRAGRRRRRNGCKRRSVEGGCAPSTSRVFRT